LSGIFLKESFKDNPVTAHTRDKNQFKHFHSKKREAALVRQPLVNLNLIVERPVGLIKEG
jgi:hypothetical protein